MAVHGAVARRPAALPAHAVRHARHARGPSAVGTSTYRLGIPWEQRLSTKHHVLGRERDFLLARNRLPQRRERLHRGGAGGGKRTKIPQAPGPQRQLRKKRCGRPPPASNHRRRRAGSAARPARPPPVGAVDRGGDARARPGRRAGPIKRIGQAATWEKGAHDGPLGRRQQHGDGAHAQSPRRVAPAQSRWVPARPRHGNGSLVTLPSCSPFFAGCSRWNAVVSKYTHSRQQRSYFFQVGESDGTCRSQFPLPRSPRYLGAAPVGRRVRCPVQGHRCPSSPRPRARSAV